MKILRIGIIRAIWDDCERAFYLGDGVFCDVRVALRGADIFVAKEFLDVANVGAGFEEVGCEAVTQGVKGCWSNDVCPC